jgi:hypothetical protein
MNLPIFPQKMKKKLIFQSQFLYKDGLIILICFIYICPDLITAHRLNIF